MASMKHRSKQITIILIILLAVIGLPLSCGSSSATFQTAELAINPVEVNPGVEIIITAQVTNTGGTEDSYSAGLRINDVTVTTAKVTIAAGASQPVSFVGALATPGTYKVTWIELIGETEVPRLTGEFVVVEADETVAPFPIPAPDFTAVDVVTNETIALTQFKGSIILLNFVNYGCNPSTNKIVSAQLLAIKELREQRDDFMPLSVFCGCCPEDTLRNFATENDLTWPWILDTDNSIVRKYASYLRKYGYPTLIFVDKEQYIREVTGYGDVSTLNVKIDETSQYRGEE